MRFYIGDKVLPRAVKTETSKYYGIITNVDYEYRNQKPNKDFAHYTQNTPKNAWWSYNSLKRIKLKDIRRTL